METQSRNPLDAYPSEAPTFAAWYSSETSRGAYPHKYAGDKYEADGILSGSALTMSQALLNLVQKAGIELGEALRMCSLYPARAVGIDNYRGRIKEGYAGEMVLLNNSGEFIKLIN